MDSDKEPMTPEGLDALRVELKQLKNFERPKISKEIEIARAHGDLKENAEYHAAKEKQSFVEGRIKDIEGKVSHAEVIDITKMSGDRVIFGSTVTILDLDDDTELTYRIVGHDQANIEDSTISYASPIAKAMMGKEEGEEVLIKTPGGKRNVEILTVLYKGFED